MDIITNKGIKGIKGITTIVIASFTISFLWGCSQMPANMNQTVRNSEMHLNTLSENTDTLPSTGRTTDSGTEQERLASLLAQVEDQKKEFQNLECILEKQSNVDLDLSGSTSSGSIDVSQYSKLSKLLRNILAQVRRHKIRFFMCCVATATLAIPCYLYSVNATGMESLENDLLQGYFSSKEDYAAHGKVHISKNFTKVSTCAGRFQDIVVNGFEKNKINDMSILGAIDLMSCIGVVGYGVYHAFMVPCVKLKECLTKSQCSKKEDVEANLKDLEDVYLKVLWCWMKESFKLLDAQVEKAKEYPIFTIIFNLEKMVEDMHVSLNQLKTLVNKKNLSPILRGNQCPKPWSGSN